MSDMGFAQFRFMLVSILTRPEGRVQFNQPRSEHMTRQVSILTRPEGRVQSICVKYRD